MKNLKPLKIVQIVLALMIGAVCLYFVAKGFEWTKIWLSVKEISLSYFLITTSATVLLYFLLRTLRWYLLLKGEDTSIPFGKLYLYNSISIGLSTVTPFQSGEAVKVELMRKYGGQRLTGYAIFFLERSLDFITVVGLGIVSLSLSGDMGVEPLYLSLIAIFFVAGLTGILVILWLAPLKRLDLVRDWIKAHRQKKLELLGAAALTLLSWLTIIYGWRLAMSFFFVDVSLVQSGLIVTMTTLLALLSFVPGAVGVAEFSISTILIKLGVEPITAQAGAIAVRLYALVILLMTFLHWIYLKFLYSKREFSYERSSSGGRFGHAPASVDEGYE